MQPLTPDAAHRLGKCEATIERGLTTFVEVGEALMEIRDQRLYRATHPRFEDYCRERWGMDRRHANRHIEAAEVVGSIDPTHPRPSSLGVTRELPREPEQAREVWAESVERHGEKPTAAQVREVRHELVEVEVIDPDPPHRPVERVLTPEERVARMPHIVADRAIRHLQDVVSTIKAAGGIDEIMRDLDATPLARTTRDSWIYFVAEAHDLLGDWRRELTEQPALRSVR